MSSSGSAVDGTQRQWRQAGQTVLPGHLGDGSELFRILLAHLGLATKFVAMLDGADAALFGDICELSTSMLGSPLIGPSRRRSRRTSSRCSTARMLPCSATVCDAASRRTSSRCSTARMLPCSATVCDAAWRRTSSRCSMARMLPFSAMPGKSILDAPLSLLTTNRTSNPAATSAATTAAHPTIALKLVRGFGGPAGARTRRFDGPWCLCGERHLDSSCLGCLGSGDVTRRACGRAVAAAWRRRGRSVAGGVAAPQPAVIRSRGSGRRASTAGTRRR